jgi:hypothetical protein
MPKPLRNSRFSRAIRSRKRDWSVNFFSVSFVLNALQHVTTSGSPQQETLRQNQGRVLRTAAFFKRNKTMKRIVIAATAVLALAGVASAQQAPALVGDYSAAVLNDYNATSLAGDVGTSFTSAASARNVNADASAEQINSQFNNSNYSR